MTVALLQSATAASAAASPTSITPTLGSASKVGNLLLLVVSVTGTTPSITAPGGTWVQVATASTTGIVGKIFASINNPGGITAVAVTVGGTGGGAVASIFEFTGVGAVAFDNVTTNTSAGASSYTLPAVPAPFSPGELIFYAVAFAAANLTPTNSNEWSPVTAATVSTNGTPNAQVANFWGVIPDGHTPTQTGSFDASVAQCRMILTFIISGTQQITQTSIGGVSGQYVGQFNQGMVGG